MRKLLWLGCCCWLSVGLAQSKSAPVFNHPFYVGAMGGYGSTTWQGLVPQASNQNLAISISTPIEVTEGGGVWGLVAGYELTPFFAFEGNYMRYPNAQITFDEDSLFAFEQDGVTSLESETQTVSLNAKVMLIIPNTSMRVFSSAGIAGIFRKDDISNVSRVTPAFGFGVNALLTDRILGEIGANYTAGYGESEINPVNDFIPFLYSVYIKAAYRFG